MRISQHGPWVLSVLAAEQGEGAVAGGKASITVRRESGVTCTGREGGSRGTPTGRCEVRRTDVSPEATFVHIASRSWCLMFLTPEQVCEMTGYRRPSGQRRWLQREGHWLSRSRRRQTIVLVSELTKAPPPHAQPNFGAIAQPRSGPWAETVNPISTCPSECITDTVDTISSTTGQVEKSRSILPGRTTEAPDLVGDTCSLSTMNGVFDRYAREVIPTKAPRTQLDYRKQLPLLRAVFGEVPPARDHGDPHF